MSDLIEQVRTEILNDIKTEKLVLPTLPEVALRVREIAEDPESNLTSLGNIISTDPALTARMIKVANSPLMRAPNAIRDLKMALMRLGMEYTANIAIGLAMEQMFQATSSVIDKRMRDVWQSSSEIAGISYVICRHRSDLLPDQALLAGLTHKIGILPILSYAEEHPNLLKDSFSLDAVIKKLHPILGHFILKKWEFPEELQQVPMTHLQFTRSIEKADYGDIVTVAMLQSYMGTDSEFGKIDYNRVTAFSRLGLVADEHIESIELDEEMKEASNFLN